MKSCTTEDAGLVARDEDGHVLPRHTDVAGSAFSPDRDVEHAPCVEGDTRDFLPRSTPFYPTGSISEHLGLGAWFRTCSFDEIFSTTP